MAGNIKGITIEFRGDTTNLDKALRSVDKETASIDSELRKVNSGLKFNPTSVELWRQKQTLLTQKVNETSERLKVLRDTQKKLDAKDVDENSKEYRELQREIVTTESKLKTFKGQLKAIGNVKLTALGAKFKQIGSKMTTVGRSMTTAVTMPIVAGFTLASKSASDYEENLNKIDVAFGDSAKTVKKWAETARKNFGMSKVQATGAASGFGALAKGIGLNEKAAAKVSTKLAGLSADLGSYFNTGTDESAKALEGIFTGEAEALKKFGVVMNDTNLQKFAEDQGLVWKEMSQTEKTMLRYNFVLAQTKDAQGDFSRTSSGTANSIKIFKSAIEDLATNIGTVLLPIITPVIQKIGEVVGKIAELPKPIQNIIVVVGLLAAAIGPVLLIVGSIATAIGTLLPLLGGLSAPVIAVAAGVAALGTAFMTAYTNSEPFRKAVNEVAKAVAGYFLVAVKAVVAEFEKLFKEISEVAEELGVDLGPALKLIIPIIKFVAKILIGNLKRSFLLVIGVIRILVAVVKTIITIFKSVFSGVAKVIGGAYNKIKTVFGNIRETIINRMNSVKERVRSIISAIKEFFNLSSIKEKVANAFNGLKEKFTGPIEKAKDKIKGIIDKIKGFFPLNIGKIFSGLKVPHFDLLWGTKDFGALGKVKYPKGFDVSWYAKGGIFNQPTLAGIGEAGPEAVVPLDKFWRKLEEMQTGDVVINVYGSDNMSVDELAQAVEQKIIQMQKRRRLAWQ